MIFLSVFISKPGNLGDSGSLSFSGDIFAGFGMSIFDEDLKTYYYLDDDGSYIPVGVRLIYNASPKFSVGAEIEFSASPFILEGDSFVQEGYVYSSEGKVSMTTFSLIGMYHLSDNIYIRGGLGRYSGSAEVKIVSGTFVALDEETDIEPGFGFNGGLGYEMPIADKITGGVEAVYHSFKGELDEFDYDVDDLDFSHWAVRAFIGTTF